MLKNMLDKGKCALGFHTGEWQYQTEADCTQVFECELCGNVNTRIQHTWDEWNYVASERCDQVRTCSRCSEEEDTITHQWGEPAFISSTACDRVVTCERCGEHEAVDPAHDWGEWFYVGADTCKQVQVCDRCQSLGEVSRQAHRWGPWRYSEMHHEAVHTCAVCNAFGTHSEFELLEDSAYTAPILSSDKTNIDASLLADTGNLESGTVAMERAWEEAIDSGQEWEYWIGKLSEEVEKEKSSGSIGELREDTLKQVLDDFHKIATNSGDDLESQITARGEIDQLMERMMHVAASPPPDDGTRASQLISLLNILDHYVMVAATRIHNSSSEFDAVLNLKRRIGWARTALNNSDDVTTYNYERETLRRLALDVQTFSQRHHLTLARPIWGNVPSTTNPDAIFYAGSPDVRQLMAQACKRNQVSLLPETGPGDHARFRYQQLQECHVSVFDLSHYDRTNEMEHAEALAPVGYELGIAFALGKPLVVIGQEGVNLPFDVNIEPVYLGSEGDDVEHLAQALDDALYGLQPSEVGESVTSTAASLQQWATDHADARVQAILSTLSPDTLKDALKTRHIIADALSHAGIRDQILIYPHWPGAYPVSSEQRCFHVTGFRPWTKTPSEEIRSVCQQHGIEYIRGDEVLDPDIIRAIWDDICRATHIVVDLSGLNINAVIELGMAHVLGRNTLIVGQEVDGVPPFFHAISKQRVHTYTLDDLKPLHDALNRFFSTSRS